MLSLYFQGFATAEHVLHVDLTGVFVHRVPFLTQPSHFFIQAQDQHQGGPQWLGGAISGGI